jgi:hypothetical protein
MSLYPLGISRRRDVPSVPKQAAGSVDMRWSLAGELACAFIDTPHQAVPPMLHAAALDAIHRRICVLPVRFGVALHDESEIHSLLEERRHELLDHLRRLDGTCEMGLRIAQSSTADHRSMRPPGTSHAAGPHYAQHRSLQAAAHRDEKCGLAPSRREVAASSQPQSALAYIEERRSHYRRIDEGEARDGSIVRQLVERLDGYHRQWRALPSSPSHSIRLAFLIERDHVAAFRNRLENTSGADQQGRCVVLGPWPPYSFV